MPPSPGAAPRRRDFQAEVAREGTLALALLQRCGRRTEYAYDAARVPDRDLDVGFRVERRPGVDGLSLDECRADRVVDDPHLLGVPHHFIDHGAVEVPSLPSIVR